MHICWTEHRSHHIREKIPVHEDAVDVVVTYGLPTNKETDRPVGSIPARRTLFGARAFLVLGFFGARLFWSLLGSQPRARMALTKNYSKPKPKAKEGTAHASSFC